MEVATLTATLEAEVTRFVANMKAADALLTELQKTIKETEGDSEELSGALKLIQVSERAITSSIGQLKKLNTSMENSQRDARELIGTLSDVKIPERAAVASGVAAHQIEDQLKDIKRQAIETDAALGDIGVSFGRIKAFGPNWGRRAFVAPPIGGPNVPNIRETDYTGGADLARIMPELLVVDRIFSDARQLIGKYPVYQPAMGPLTREQYLNQYATPIEGRRLVQIGGEIPPNPAYNFPPVGRGDIAGATRYLRSRGITFEPGALGGMGRFRTGGRVAEDALIAGALGLGRESAARDFLRVLGWGSGGGIHIPGIGIVGGGGRGGFGLFGRNIFGGMAGFGTPLGLAGFGAERALFSSIGILGSLGGGILGGGVLGMGALGTMAVGAGTNMAGVGQAIGDIHTVTGDLNSLNDAIQQYGKNSTQAAQAQAQLNQDLKGFSPVARNAVLAASQQSIKFRELFDKFTGPAEKIGAQIVNQAMQVGEKFLPTIGKFAHQNMLILQSGLQPFFSWLTKGGNQQNVIQDVNKLVQAQKEFGKNSVQAAEANQKLMQAQKNVGGLGLFTDLEKVFQKNFPTAIHAGEQGFELFMKTVDLAAQHLGHFMATLNRFFTRMNNQDFGTWASGVEKLIGLFHSWIGMFASFGRLLFDVFRPAVGLGQAFAELMTHIFNQVGKYINQPGTQNILHNLFSAHLVQLIQQIGGLIMNLLPIVESIASAFIQMEAVMATAFGKIIAIIRDVFGWINKLGGGGVDKLLGWAIALRIIYKANQILLGSLLGLLRNIPLIGSLFGTSASEAETASGAITESVNAAAASIVGAVDRATISVQNLIREFLGIGPAAEKSAVEADAAMGTIGASAAGAGEAGLLGRIGIGGFARGGMFALGGIVASQLVKSMFPGHGGHIAGNIIAGAGIGAGIGSIIPGVGTLVGGGVGALVGGIISIAKNGPSATQQLRQMSNAAHQFGRAAQLAAASGHKLLAMKLNDKQNVQYNEMASVITKVNKALQQESDKMRNKAITDAQAVAALKQSGMEMNQQNLQLEKNAMQTQAANNVTNAFIQKLQGMAQSLQATSPKLAEAIRQIIQITQALHKMPSHKTITITLKYGSNLRVGPGGDLFPAGPRGIPGFGGDPRGSSHPHIQLQLPGHIQYLIDLANAGKYNQVKADKMAYEFYQRQLQQSGLTTAQRRRLLQAEAQYYSAIYGQPGGLPSGVPKPGQAGNPPPHYLARQQAESARARIDINNGQYKAAIKLLDLEKRQLDAMLKTAKTQAERTAILSQLSSVSSDLKSAKQTLSGVSPNSFALPLALQEAMARADALAALNPNLQGPTALQIKLAKEAKAVAMRAIRSHTLSMQQLIDAWNIVQQSNQVLAQQLTNKLNTYHVAGTDAVLDTVKGLTHAQEMQLRELMAERDAHRGYLPNQGGAGSQPASHHNHHHHNRGSGGSPQVYSGSESGNIIIHGNVILHGVSNKSELWAEMKNLDRQHAQRAGARR